MVFCIIALVVFGVLGIFSAKYRTYFKEALRCVFRQITLRKCDTDFDNKMKSKITAKLMNVNPHMAKIVYKRFALISWVFIILMFGSIAATGIGIYNAISYGNCDGQESTEFCIFNPGTTGDSGYSVQDGMEKGQLIPASPDDDPYIGGEDVNVTIIEFGCFSCKYTKTAELVRKQVIEKYRGKIKFVFRNFPLPKHPFSREAAEAADCALEQNKYWEYHDKLFESQKNMSIEKIKEIAIDLGLDTSKFDTCFDTKKYKDEVERDYQDGLKSKIYGTPTFFINGRPLVGPQSLGAFSRIIDEELVK